MIINDEEVLDSEHHSVLVVFALASKHMNPYAWIDFCRQLESFMGRGTINIDHSHLEKAEELMGKIK